MQLQTHPNIPHKKARPNNRQCWLPWVIVGGGFSIGVLLILAMVVFLAIVYTAAGHIPQGVKVAGVSVGGKTVEVASSVLQNQLASQRVKLVDGSREWSLSLNDLGVRLDSKATAADALKAAPGSSVQPHYSVDLNQTQSGLVALSGQTNVAAAVGQVGRAMDIPVILDRLRVDASGELADGTLELDMFEVEPLEPETGANYTGVPTKHIVQPGQELGLIAREYNVSIDDILQMNSISNPDLLYIGQELTIPAPGIYEPTQADAPPAPTNSGKSILVSLGGQRVFAYENGQLVHSHLASTGLPATPTVLGDYSIYVKYAADDMSGPGYFLPQVPYTMYFYQGYAIHGTYWHNSFGRPMSHGCVNLPTDEARWFFDWASVGTPVRVIA